MFFLFEIYFEWAHVLKCMHTQAHMNIYKYKWNKLKTFCGVSRESAKKVS